MAWQVPELAFFQVYPNEEIVVNSGNLEGHAGEIASLRFKSGKLIMGGRFYMRGIKKISEIK